ncbi:MAG: 16S rRNA (cytosine(1402)-N(4))-methyltransferase RsmH [Chloroflexi bacterium]|nr:16S rRNA (cytosine(1402)-N(4))-methyltransferase RsmH [Chloroflexota bacterium]
MQTSNTGAPFHAPALLQEVVQFLDLRPGGRWVDGTLGDGGHALAILEGSAPDGRLMGLDADGAALERARQRLQPYAGRMLLVNSNFARIAEAVRAEGLAPVDGIILDLGLSSWQLDVAARGFSFRDDAPLDMRLSASQEVTAAEVANTYGQEDLARIIATYGQEPQARRIAQAIVRRRPIATALELARIVESVSPRRGQRVHPATRTFQALRISVNGDMENLAGALEGAAGVLRQGGRLVVIAYHSLEDTVVKEFMRRESRDCICPPERPQCICGHKARVRVLTKKVVKPSPEEVARNPRVRSARLRACALL